MTRPRAGRGGAGRGGAGRAPRPLLSQRHRWAPVVGAGGCPALPAVALLFSAGVSSAVYSLTQPIELKEVCFFSSIECSQGNLVEKCHANAIQSSNDLSFRGKEECVCSWNVKTHYLPCNSNRNMSCRGYISHMKYCE